MTFMDEAYRSQNIMIKLLFVCHGNICRSPMAEFVMKDLVRKAGREEQFIIASKAARRDELGNDTHYGTKAKLRQMGVPFEKRKATLLSKSDYDAYDYLIAMDRENVSDMLRLFGGDPDKKIHMLLEFAGLKREVADPWYTGNFDETYEDVLIGCKGLMRML
jgi:protein-tyrosine phosphatase